MKDLSEAAQLDYVRQLFAQASLVLGAVPYKAGRGGVMFYVLKITAEVMAIIAEGRDMVDNTEFAR